MENLVLQIAKALVDNTDDLECEVLIGQGTTVIELRAPKSEIGKIIGKNGRIAQAIRTIVTSSGAKDRRRYVLQIVEGD